MKLIVLILLIMLFMMNNLQRSKANSLVLLCRVLLRTITSFYSTCRSIVKWMNKYQRYLIRRGYFLGVKACIQYFGLRQFLLRHIFGVIRQLPLHSVAGPGLLHGHPDFVLVEVVHQPKCLNIE